MQETVFGDTNLRNAKGLESSHHFGPCVIDHRTLQRSGSLPLSFLRGCGLPDDVIDFFRDRSRKAIRTHSCVIGYSTKDEEFATRLHNDFQAKGIRCWKWDHDARTGRDLWGEVDQAIRDYDKLVLIASESSLKSPAVNREIERAIQQEDERERKKQAGEYSGDTNVLFTVRLDDYIFEGWEHHRKADVIRKVIANACGWDKDPNVYAKVLDRLIRDLKAESQDASQNERSVVASGFTPDEQSRPA